MSRRGVVIAAGAAFVLAAGGVHLALLGLSPAWATDHQISEGLRRGGAWNTLIHGKPPRAGATSVPLANPDTLGSRAYLDLSKGPLVLEGLRPASCTYWSASVFAHDTDTVKIVTDTQTPDRRISLTLRLADQPAAAGDEAVLPSPKGVLLLRCFMRDRTDTAYLAQLDQERRGLTLRAAGPAR